MPETCENWLGRVNSCVYYARQTREIYQLLPYWMILKLPGALKSTVFSKCSFIWNKGSVNILRWVAANLFSAIEPTFAHKWLWWVAEAFHAPPCSVILLQNRVFKNHENGTRWDLVAV